MHCAGYWSTRPRLRPWAGAARKQSTHATPGKSRERTCWGYTGGWSVESHVSFGCSSTRSQALYMDVQSDRLTSPHGCEEDLYGGGAASGRIVESLKDATREA